MINDASKKCISVGSKISVRSKISVKPIFYKALFGRVGADNETSFALGVFQIFFHQQK